MSLLGLERSQTTPADNFDHAINLVDATTTEDSGNDVVDGADGANDATRISSESERISTVDNGAPLSRQWTKSSLRKELARRKYAKYQRGDEDDEGKPSLQDTRIEEEGGESQNKPKSQGTLGTQGRLRDKVPFRAKKKHQRHRSKDDTVIDVLYENQRGCFLCGIPLYSSNSLLNFDPSQWQNGHFQDSAVDIRDAQLPDPSWEWVWRTWYVDMSHDVDEQGWEYSFSFNTYFNWHGSHPWFHSFVRRRRWLRKRVKIHGHISEKREGRSLKDAHKLTKDYFTIHAAKRDRSRDTSGDRTTTFRSSGMGSLKDQSDDDEAFEEIPDIPTLLEAIKRARVDREKITAVLRFTRQGGEEILYLADNVNAIMDDLIHQTSRRQFQNSLLRALDDATKARDSPEGSDEEKEARSRKIENLIKAVDAAGVHVNDQEYWTDLKARSNISGTSNSDAANVEETHALDAEKDVSLEGGDRTRDHILEEGGGVADDIKGISEDAEISKAPGIRRPKTETETETETKDDDGAQQDKKADEEEEDEQEEEEEGKKKLDKGKGKEKEIA